MKLSIDNDVGEIDALERLAAFSASLVGQVGVERAQQCIKAAMLEAALERTGGNYGQTARLLDVTRQAVQQMVIRFNLRTWVEERRRDAH
ncbi:MAG TPA: helix-turn-helix domain-containing protein [Polyangiaceae bacterium]|nr:helix-turn-helix domain-containing protein [Polyangiaceae bacterium]